ncbi:methyl-accepting chemotaxis protein [Idiomarina xiamenensis]|uniref:Chemotactic transducer PctC n=1 Tax=Idiomarina xiamenensis 10-D-4 TaxID=740709 RepID=K2JVV4_9GAMM|nr:methyl-accepting chemotaxis protein [Idiomarina xiamenensis]EKE87536.1 chemotactic transducer PctC [Idiomarina xiamenensis 10-D-4]
MMRLTGSLQRKLIISISGVLVVLLALAGYLVTQQLSTLTREKTEAQVYESIRLKAETIKGFFAERARIPLTLFQQPRIRRWLVDYQQRGKNLDDDVGYQDMIATFQAVSSADPTLKSVFVGSANTYEYFYEQGRVGVDSSGPHAGDPKHGYFTNQRPWWQEAIDAGQLYLTSPQVDATDGTVSTVLQMPIYDDEQRLLGVGGVDILISTIADLIDGIDYQGQGQAFLVNEQQQLVYFPSDRVELALNSPLRSLDQVFNQAVKDQQTQGFAELAKQIKTSDTGHGWPLTLRGKDYRVFYVPVASSTPDIQWTLGILVPAALIEGPIAQARWYSLLTIVLIIAVLTLTSYWISRNIFRPVKAIAEAMQDVAQGEGDLTRRLQVNSNDEVGAMARAFNRFADKIQALVQQAYSSSVAVNEAAERVSETVSTLNREVNYEQQQIRDISDAVSAMHGSAAAINEYGAQTTQAISEATEAMQVVSDNSTQTQGLIENVSSDISQITEAVNQLNKDVAEIGSVLEVINSIAEQTNLLALNAAIEAARAGEQGRGFAVVADEVRELATRTQRSTDNIRSTVEQLRHSAGQVKSSMQRTDELSDKGVQQVQQVLAAITDINQAVAQVKDVNEQIASATAQQQQQANTVRDKLDGVHQLTEQAVQHASTMQQDFEQLNSVSTELKITVKRFKV